MTIRTVAALTLTAILPIPALAQSTQEAAPAVADSARIEEIVVTGVRERLYKTGTLKDVILKTEVVDDRLIESRQAVNLSQAIAASPGVRVSNECSMCGVKRIMLNGMRGEHTTVLTDGMPLHTMLAGYYAVDAIAMTGVKRIEVARGAGASLISPEAIGGTINVISKEPEQTGLELDAAVEEGEGYLVSSLGTLVSDDGRHRFSVVTQLDRHDRVDGDDNGVSEAPLQDNKNLILRLSSDLSAKDNLTIRTAYVDSEIFGGPMTADNVGDVLAAFDGVCVGATVRERRRPRAVHRRALGNGRVDRHAACRGLGKLAARVQRPLQHDTERRLFGTRSGLVLRGFRLCRHRRAGIPRFSQQLRRQRPSPADLRIDRRDEKMRSTSAAGEISANYVEDSFDYTVAGIYFQDTWTVGDNLEIAAAVRVDDVKADFVAAEKPGTEIDETSSRRVWTPAIFTTTSGRRDSPSDAATARRCRFSKRTTASWMRATALPSTLTNSKSLCRCRIR